MNAVNKLIYMTTAFPGPRAASLQVARMCDAFAASGVEVELVRSCIPLQRQPSASAMYGLRRPFRIASLPGFPPLRNYDPVFRLSLSVFVRSLGRSRSRGHVVLYGRSPAILPLSYLLRMKQNGKADLLPRIFCEVHEGLDERGIALLRLTDGIVVITRALQTELVSRGIEPPKILMAPDAVDLESYLPLRERDRRELRRELGLPLDGKLVVFTGHLYADRGIELLLAALQHLEDGVLAVLVGGFPADIERVRRLAQELAVQERVLLLGHKPAWQVPAFQICADVLVVPYSSKWRIQQWSSPLKLFEYMASGNPIVSVDFPSLREILADGTNCVLVPTDNPQGLANGIRKVLADRELGSAISRRAFADVQQYTWCNRAARVLEFIRGE